MHNVLLTPHVRVKTETSRVRYCMTALSPSFPCLQVVTLTNPHNETYKITLNSAIQFGVLFNPYHSYKQARVSELYRSDHHLLQQL